MDRRGHPISQTFDGSVNRIISVGSRSPKDAAARAPNSCYWHEDERRLVLAEFRMTRYSRSSMPFARLMRSRRQPAFSDRQTNTCRTWRLFAVSAESRLQQTQNILPPATSDSSRRCVSDVDVVVAWPPAVSHMSTTVHSGQSRLTGSRHQASFLWSASPPAPLTAGQSADDCMRTLVRTSLSSVNQTSDTSS